MTSTEPRPDQRFREDGAAASILIRRALSRTNLDNATRALLHAADVLLTPEATHLHRAAAATGASGLRVPFVIEGQSYPLTETERRLLGHLVEHADQDGVFRAGRRELERGCHISSQNADQAITALEHRDDERPALVERLTGARGLILYRVLIPRTERAAVSDAAGDADVAPSTTDADAEVTTLDPAAATHGE